MAEKRFFPDQIFSEFSFINCFSVSIVFLLPQITLLILSRFTNFFDGVFLEILLFKTIKVEFFCISKKVDRRLNRRRTGLIIGFMINFHGI